MFRIFWHKRAHPAPLVADFMHIQLRKNRLVFKACSLCQHASVLCNHMMPGKNEILGGFSIPRARVDIAAQKPRARGSDQALTVGVLSHRLVGGGQVDNHRRARLCKRRRGRVHHPDVLAQLTAHHKPFQIPAGKQQISAKGYGLSQHIHLGHFPAACRKMPHLIKFPIVWNILLRDKPQDPAVLHCCCHIVKLSVFFKGKPHKGQRIVPFRMLQHRLQPFQTFFQQAFLQKQILTGIPGQAQFRQNDQLRTLCITGVQRLTDFQCVPGRVCNTDFRCSRRSF